MMDDKEISEMARGHNPPPEIPVERMWAKIDAARVDRRKVVKPDFTPRRNPAFRIMRLTAAVAAVLTLGVFIGRMTRQPETVPVVAPPAVATGQEEAASRDIRKDIYTLAARDLFSRADFLLTDFKYRSCGKDDLSRVPDWAGGMLVQTRLLLDTPVAEDTEMKNLLEDLELVLAQIVGLSKNDCARDMAWIRRGLKDKSTIDRLRTISAGAEI